MLRGAKRFRVAAGAALGGTVGIDHCMAVGDAVFIPALAFHSGGGQRGAADWAAPTTGSMLLSVAFTPAPAKVASEATAAVELWRAARQRLGERLGTDARRGGWEWAATREGAARLRSALCVGHGDALERFIPPHDRARDVYTRA